MYYLGENGNGCLNKVPVRLIPMCLRMVKVFLSLLEGSPVSPVCRFRKSTMNIMNRLEL